MKCAFRNWKRSGINCSFLITSADTMRTSLRLALGAILNIVSTTKAYASRHSVTTVTLYATHIFPSYPFRAGKMRVQCSLFSSCFVASSAIYPPNCFDDAHITDVIHATPVISFFTSSRDIL